MYIQKYNMSETSCNIAMTLTGIFTIIFNTMLAFFYTLMMAIIPDNHLEVRPKNQVSNTFCLYKLNLYY